MPIIRNPFRRNDENARINGVEKNNVEAPKAIEIKEPTEYKLSGEFLVAFRLLRNEMVVNVSQRSMTAESTFQYAIVKNLL